MTGIDTQREATIRVVVADDHGLFREGVAGLLSRAEDIVVVGEAATGQETIQLVQERGCDVVLMDLKMPGMSGIEATRELLRIDPRIGVIALTMWDDDDSVWAALQAGARGYVLKDASRGMLLQAIRDVARGDALLGPSIARRVIQQISSPAPAQESPLEAMDALTGPFEALTAREMDVLRLMADGLRNRAIAERLVISEKTVGNHISNIFAKLQVTDRSQAIVLALRAGLGSSSV